MCFKLIHNKVAELRPIQEREEMLLEGASKASTLWSVLGQVGRPLNQLPA